MIVPSKSSELICDAESVFTHPDAFGVVFNQAGHLISTQLLESLLVFDKWCWLTMDDFEDVIFRSDRFRLVDGSIEYLGSIPCETFTSNSTPVPLKLYAPSAAEPPPSIDSLIKFYDRLQVALLISGSREGSFENAAVMSLDTPTVMRAGVTFTPRDYGIALSTRESKTFLKPVLNADIETLLHSLLYEIKLCETLYLDDMTHQADAARYLFQSKPQEAIEAELLKHLTDSDRYVRMNVLTALGLPVYSVGFRPGAQLPPKEERLEPVTLSPYTVRHLLAWAETEKDLGVIDYLICTLKYQNYQGKLREVTPEVREFLRKIVLKLEVEQTIKDCKELLRELPV